MKKILFTVFVFLAAVLVFSAVLILLIYNKGKGALQITSSPNAKVYIDDKLIGTSPLCKCDTKTMIPQGDYTLKLVAVSGSFKSFEQKITIEPRVLTVVDNNFLQNGLGNTSIINLVPIEDKSQAQINITTFPQDAQVYVDNKLVGQSPETIQNINVSDHELRFSKKSYDDKIVRVRTVLGFKLNAVIYLSLNQDVTNSSSGIDISSSSAMLNVKKVKILDTPTGFLRVRQDASLTSTIIGQVSPGETYVLLGEEDNWFKIELTNKIQGWINSQYASKVN